MKAKRICFKSCAQSSSSSLGATALREPWPPVLLASTGLYPDFSFSMCPIRDRNLQLLLKICNF
jgi:hypothetical protein